MEQRKELTGFYLFMRMETILSNFIRNWQSFTASLVLQIVMWHYRDTKEPLTPEEGKQNEENKKQDLDENASTHKAWSLWPIYTSKMSMFSPTLPTVQT